MAELYRLLDARERLPIVIKIRQIHGPWRDAGTLHAPLH
jgi:hypothetical protein